HLQPDRPTRSQHPRRLHQGRAASRNADHRTTSRRSHRTRRFRRLRTRPPLGSRLAEARGRSRPLIVWKTKCRSTFLQLPKTPGVATMPMSRHALMTALMLTSALAAQPAGAETPKDTLVIVSEMGPNGLDTMV